MSLPHGSYTQVAFVTHDLAKTIDHWVTTLGAGPFFVFDNVVDDVIYRGSPGQDTNRAAMGFLGATNVELFQPTNDAPSMYREILDNKGETIHHTIPSMRPVTPEEFDALCAGYERQGLEVAYSGALPHIGRIRFYDALDQIGQFVEAVELNAEAFSVMDLMYDAHASWDGTDPVRSFDVLLAGLTQ